ncbi:hypothetical protein BXU08_01100 [Sphingomonas sp. LM7]|nr:hypothetical protein BXU08_01100 [Sphingomonas sp. LM7]
MLALAAVLNYVDRQTLALMAGVVQRDLGIDDVSYAWLVNAFLAAYMIGGLISAWLVARLGAGRAMAVLVTGWSLASAASGLVHDPWQLAMTRFVLGIAEAGGWIASAKLVQEWFPKGEQALGIGIYSAAAHIGAALSPLAITALLLSVGWRITFGLTGAVGILWLLAWLALYRPAQKPVRSIDEPVDPEPGSAAWSEIFATRGVWGIATANALVNPVWFFYLFWFPKYLTEERGLTIAEMGRLSWIVYAAAGLGSIAGGVASGALIRRGMRPARARVAAMAAVAMVAPLGALNALEPSVAISLALGALVAFGHTAWVTNQTALFVDLYPPHQVGRVMGIAGVVTGLVTILSTYMVGQLVASITYRPMFLVIAIAYPLGLAAAFFATTQRRAAPVAAAA